MHDNKVSVLRILVEIQKRPRRFNNFVHNFINYKNILKQ